MKIERKHVFIVGVILIVTFQMVLLFSPIIPVEEIYFDIDAGYDEDANFEVKMSRIPSMRTVYKSIMELILGR